MLTHLLIVMYYLRICLIEKNINIVNQTFARMVSCRRNLFIILSKVKIVSEQI